MSIDVYLCCGTVECRLFSWCICPFEWFTQVGLKKKTQTITWYEDCTESQIYVALKAYPREKEKEVNPDFYF